MSAEFWAIIGVGVALIGVVVPLMLGLHVSLRAEVRTEIAALRAEVHGEIASLRSEMRAEFAAVNERLLALEQRVSALEQRVARLEGAFEEMRRWSELVINTMNRPAA